MPRYNRLRTSGDREFTDRDSYLFQASEDPIGDAAPAGPVPSAVTVYSGPPSSSADEDATGSPLPPPPPVQNDKQHSPPGKGEPASVTSPPTQERQNKDLAFDNGGAPPPAREASGKKAPSSALKGSSASHHGGSRFGATLHKVTAFRDSGKQSKYSRVVEQGGDPWGDQQDGELGEDNGREDYMSGAKDPWGQQQHRQPALNSALANPRSSSLRDAGSWAAAVQRTASVRDPGGHYGGGSSQFERHLSKGSSHYSVVPDPVPFDKYLGRADSFERVNGNGYGRGRGGGGYGEDSDVFVPTRDREEIPSSLGAAVQRALSLREGHLAAASTRAAAAVAAATAHQHGSHHHSQRFQKSRDYSAAEYSTPVYARSGGPEDWEQAELRFWANGQVHKVHSQSMRYDRVTIPLHDAEDDYSHRASSVGERDRNAALKRGGSVREQGVHHRVGGSMSSARVYSMRDQSHFLQCATCGRNLGVVVKGLPDPDDAKFCQACSRPNLPATHWTDPAFGKDSIPSWAAPPRKKKGFLHSWRRMLGLKPATSGASS